MRLLFDQNISYKLVQKLEALFPGSKHLKELGLEEAGLKLTYQNPTQHFW